MVVNKLTAKIICICVRQGKTHDFRIFKESATHVSPEVLIAVDSGYQGLQKIHANTELPKKRTKKKSLLSICRISLLEKCLPELKVSNM